MRRLLSLALVLAACGSPEVGATPTAETPPVTVVPTFTSSTVTTVASVTTTTTLTLPDGVIPAPPWLGTRILPLRPDGFGEIQPTPAEMIDRRFVTPDHLPPPPDDEFHATAGSVPPEVAARSTWREECPVTLDELTYLTVSFWGFDQRNHTGELIVNDAVAEDIVEVFRRLHEVRFPIEEMRVIRLDEVDAPPTGDGNVTSVLECREATGGTSWSQHSYGLAIDINPFHNPYLRGEVVLPELASAYTDRDDVRPGMIVEGDVVMEAFAEIGWAWGGNWKSLKDWMHFSLNGG